MTPSYTRRYRRSRSASRESAAAKKDNQQAPFFAGATHEGFFKPAAIQRKCDSCEAEDKKVKRAAGPKEEEKKINKAEDKKEEDKTLHKMAAPKEEEKKISKAEDKKEEDKTLHKMAGPKEEEKKINKAEEEKKLDKKEAGGGLAATGNYIHSLNGKGNSLPGETNQFFKKRMGHDFSHVKIHTGTEAEHSAKEMNAKAYAVDHNIVFNKGRYNPQSAEGKKLLAHELTHVVQQKGNGGDLLNRVTETSAGSHAVTGGGKATNSHNERAYGCEGVNLQGHTDANYADSYTAAGSAAPSTKCNDECAADCVTASGNIVSVFQASPAVTLPSVPDGLSDCENTAVTTFINTTLNNHEQKHVKAFNTYNATIKTPYKFVGCQSNLDAYQQSIHDAINAKRQAAANAKSDALDPFNPPIPCKCD